MNLRILQRTAILTVVPALVAAQAGREPAQQTPVFKTDVESVDVDVVVTDKRGNFVRGLSAGDFEVFEDDVWHEVSTFSFVDLPTSTSGAPGIAIEGDAPEGRRFIMILNGHGPRLAHIAWQFVDQALGPHDEMAVYYNNPVNNAFVEGQSFTASKPLLRAVIRRVEPAFRPFPPLRFLDRRQMEEERARIELEKYEMLKRAMEQIATTPGRRKAVLWFGGSLPFTYSGPRGLELALAYRDVIRAAARHHVVIYPIDPTGMTTRLGARELMRMGGLRALAEDTGVEGIVGTNGFQKGYARIVRDMSTYYLLGYYPQVRHRDGRFHSIRVRVKHPNVSVRARKGYFADEPLSERSEAPRPPEAIEAALGALSDSDRRPLDRFDVEPSNDSASVVPPRDAPLGEPVWWRRGSLARAPYVRTTDPQFTRSERLRLELPTNTTTIAAARLLDRMGVPLPVALQVAERPDASAAFQWAVVDVTLAPLGLGEYVIEVVQGDSVRVVAFRIVPER